MFEAFKELKKYAAEVGSDFQAKMFKSTFDIHHFHGSHNKFMVTDISGFIGTSNWSGDYFTDTAGISVVFEPIKNTVDPRRTNLLLSLQRIFERDFNSYLAKII